MPDFTNFQTLSPFRRETIADDASEEEVAVECDVSPDGVSIFAEQRIGCRSANILFQVSPSFARTVAVMLMEAAQEAEIAAKEFVS